jgi:hypothetical protein
MRCRLKCHLRSYGSKKLSDEKHSPGADARNWIGGVRGGLGPRMEGYCAAGCVVGNSYGQGSVESVWLEPKGMGMRGPAVKTVIPFQQENTVCLNRMISGFVERCGHLEVKLDMAS